MPDLTRLDTYDYELPPELIAQAPLAERDSSRLLVIDRAAGTFQHRTMRDFPDLLQPADCLVLNDSRVVPARLTGRRARTGGRWEGLYLGLLPEGDWKLIGQTRGRLEPGEQVTIPAPDSSGDQSTIDRNSCRVIGLSRNAPSIRLVTMSVPCLCTPRVVMQ